MGSVYDPNIPEFTEEGEYFCPLCFATMNSEQMWTSHIAGKRHIKNVQKYPNGLPRHSDDDDSFDRPAVHDRYEKEGYDDYSCMKYRNYYSADDYCKNMPIDYVPEVIPNVVIDYGHSKKLDDILHSNPKASEVVPEENVVNIDALIADIKKSEAQKNVEKDDFFEKLNQRALAKDLVEELTKKRFLKNEIESKGSQKRSRKEESPDIDEDMKHSDK